jgi:prevent-host-death family protein
MKSFSLTQLKRHSEEVWDEALANAVTITKRRKRILVAMDAKDYEKLVLARSRPLESEPHDNLTD